LRLTLEPTRASISGQQLQFGEQLGANTVALMVSEPGKFAQE
jgi:hypothetical protein